MGTKTEDGACILVGKGRGRRENRKKVCDNNEDDNHDDNDDVCQIARGCVCTMLRVPTQVSE